MYKIIAVIVIWLCSITIAGWLSYGAGVDKEATKFIKYRQQQQTLVLEQQEQHKVKLTEQLKDKEDAIKSINKRHATIVSGLRQRTERPVTVPTVKEASSAPVCTGTGSTGEQLYRQDAEFLIGEAAKADILREALKTCRTQLSEQ
jgi:hypothetical protein